MKMKYTISKLSAHLERWGKKRLVLQQDFFYYYKPDTEDRMHSYHISELTGLEMAKEEGLLVLKINFRDKERLTIAIKEDNKLIEDIRDFLLIARRMYDVGLAQFQALKVFKADYNVPELKSNIANYTTNSCLKSIDDMLKRHKQAIDSQAMIVFNRIQPLIALTRKAQEEEEKDGKESKDNGFEKPFEPFPFGLEAKHKVNAFTMSNSDIQSVHDYYFLLVQMLSTIRKSLIAQRFHKDSLVRTAMMNSRNTFNLINFDSLGKNCKEEEVNIDKDKNLKSHPNQKQQLEELKKQNQELKGQYFTSLSKHSKKKEKLKRLVITSHIKIFTCFNCGNLLLQTDSEQPTCLYDNNCTNNSLFHCRKCDIAYCTYCIIYQRNTKCANNHRLFHSKVPDLCLLCSDSDSKAYFSCQHCGVAVCAQCIGERLTKEVTCFNCNMELFWRRQLYSTCSKCLQERDCFWGCSNCDYYLCLRCVSQPQGFCGAAHRLELVSTGDKWGTAPPKQNSKFWKSLDMQFIGKCMKCDMLIEGKCFACLRCSYFLCLKCN